MKREQILYYAVKYRGEWNKITEAFANNECWEYIKYDGNYITIVDYNYPSELRQLRYAPWILFYEGNLNLLNKKMISVAGARKCNMHGLDTCRDITNILKAQYVIVSGLSKGIDGWTHRYALTDHTIGVIGCGIDVGYPSTNEDLYKVMKEHHLILSEYPNGVHPYAHHYPWRNRIIAALGKSLIVIQSYELSGTMLMVEEVIALGKTVYCIPDYSNIQFEKGYNRLLAKGAIDLYSIADINTLKSNLSVL